MPDTPPGQSRGSHGFDGEFVTITREEYTAIRYPGGRNDRDDGWQPASTRTDTERGDYWTAWCKPDDPSVPMVANEMDGCNNDPTHETCPGTHTFMRFIPDEETPDE